MNQVNISSAQAAQAALTGLTLLNDDSVRVPINMAMSGDLQVLKVMLASIANGNVVLANLADVTPKPATPIIPADGGDGGEKVQE